MSGMQKGTTFVDGNTYSAVDFNNLVDNATPTVALINQWTQQTSPIDADRFLIYDSVNAILKYTTVANIRTGIGVTQLAYALTDTGAANAYVANTTPSFTAYLTGQLIVLKVVNSNTGASTVNLNSIGTKNIFYKGIALTGKEIAALGTIFIIYDGTQFQLIGKHLPEAQEVKKSMLNSDAIMRDLVCGRLCLTTLTPIHTTDVSGTTIYFTPYKGNSLSLYDGTNWNLYNFSEVSLALTATSGSNYDVFIYDNATVLTLEILAWTNNTTRATALALQDGVYVKSGATTRRYLGSFRASTTNTTKIGFGTLAANGGQAQVFLWNYYNRAPYETCVRDSTDSWTYGTATWRPSNNQTTNSSQVIIGVIEDPIRATTTGLASGSGGANFVNGIGVNVTNQFTGITGYSNSTAQTVLTGSYNGFSGLTIGVNTITAIEYDAGGGTSTWYGDIGVVYIQSGLIVGGMY